MVALLKFIHIGALALWCAGLFALPLMLGRADPTGARGEALRMRVIAHHAYAYVVTPAAVTATAAGGALIFARAVFVPWMFAKLGLVGLMVVIHAYLGHQVAKLGERGEVPSAVPTAALVGAGATLMAAVIVLVLAKPVLTPDLVPDWLRQPLHRQLPFPVVPSR